MTAILPDYQAVLADLERRSAALDTERSAVDATIAALRTLIGAPVPAPCVKRAKGEPGPKAAAIHPRGERVNTKRGALDDEPAAIDEAAIDRVVAEDGQKRHSPWRECVKCHKCTRKANPCVHCGSPVPA